MGGHVARLREIKMHTASYSDTGYRLVVWHVLLNTVINLWVP